MGGFYELIMRLVGRCGNLGVPIRVKESVRLIVVSDNVIK